jgi:hypothetical protein
MDNHFILLTYIFTYLNFILRQVFHFGTYGLKDSHHFCMSVSYCYNKTPEPRYFIKKWIRDACLMVLNAGKYKVKESASGKGIIT